MVPRAVSPGHNLKVKDCMKHKHSKIWRKRKRKKNLTIPETGASPAPALVKTNIKSTPSVLMKSQKISSRCHPPPLIKWESVQNTNISIKNGKPMSITVGFYKTDHFYTHILCNPIIDNTISDNIHSVLGTDICIIWISDFNQMKIIILSNFCCSVWLWQRDLSLKNSDWMFLAEWGVQGQLWPCTDLQSTACDVFIEAASR